ncbi:MAG: NAD-dependent epimerase/dehydratase family protein [Eubacteriales bacterium]|nr:NAD-dependent epimerase/dehydratase family protein [Eubacteriales bacterium]
MYYITGATGFLGLHIVKMLLEKGEKLRVLVYPGDPAEKQLPSGVEIIHGDVSDKESVKKFLEPKSLEKNTVIHCAGLISIAWKYDKRLWNINVLGTKNITDICVERNYRLIYVSSVHAMQEKPGNEPMEEVSAFSPSLVVGAYAKTKAAASAYVVDSVVNRGLNAAMVFPSGITGPGALANNSVTHMIKQCALDKLPAGTKGGYNFVDVRDVALGIVNLCYKPNLKGGFILSGHYKTIAEFFDAIYLATDKKTKRIKYMVPRWLVSVFVVPIYKIIYAIKKETPIYTRYSIYTLGRNANYVNKKAQELLNFKPRVFNITVNDTVLWMKENGLIKY